MPELNESFLTRQTSPAPLAAAAATTIGAESLDTDPDSPWRKWGDADAIITGAQREKAMEAAEKLFYSSPLAHHIIEQYTDFVVGEGGFELTSSNRDARRVLYDFWHSPVHALPMNLYYQIMEYFVYGELCYLKRDHPDGFVALTFVPPREIDSVTEKDGVPGKPAKVILKSEKDKKESEKGYDVIDWDPTANALAGDCFYFRMQHLGKDVRGYSRLLPLIDFLRAWEAFTYNYLGKRASWDAIWWEITLMGYTQAQIDEWLKNHREPPAPGSQFAHNELVTYELKQPDFRSSGVDADASWYLDFLKETSGLGSEGRGRRRVREVGEILDPVSRGLSTRQWEVRSCYAYIGYYVLQEAIARGTLPEIKGGYDVVCQAPRLGVRDFQRSAGALMRTVEAMGKAEEMEWVTKRANAEIYQDLLARIGMVEKVKSLRIDEEEEAGKGKWVDGWEEPGDKNGEEA